MTLKLESSIYISLVKLVSRTETALLDLELWNPSRSPLLLRLFASCNVSGPSPGAYGPGPGYPWEALIQFSASACQRVLVHTSKEGWDPGGVLLHFPECWLMRLWLFLWYRHLQTVVLWNRWKQRGQGFFELFSFLSPSAKWKLMENSFMDIWYLEISTTWIKKQMLVFKIKDCFTEK